jgi:putative nucleotide binding protein
VVEKMEDYAHILDYLPQGLPAERGFKHEPLAYALGETEFKLFELVPKPNAIIGIGERVYIGKEPALRDKVAHVKRRVSYEELTSAAHSELPFVVIDVTKQNEVRFVLFYNEAQAITTRFHMLELLPGLGNKTMWAIIEERKKGPFKSFEDIAKRVTSFKHPEKVIAKRIEIELSDPAQKYHIFVAR